MPEYVVEIPVVGFVSVIVQAKNKEEAFDKAFEIASECQYKTDGQDSTLEIEDLEVVENLNDYEPNLSFSSIRKL